MAAEDDERTQPLGDREQRLEQIVNDYMERAAAGEPVDQEAYVRDNPDLADELRGVFHTLGFIEAAGKAAGAPRMESGEQLGDFRIVREIGRGGMGVVYEALQVSLDRRVALKVLPASALISENALERFRREAHTAGRLHHTSIVPVYAVGEERGVFYYAMQFIEGRSLGHFLKQARREKFCPDREYYRRVARWGRQAAEALAYAHKQRVIHRDVKPANLMLDRDDNAWVFDFGLARTEGSPAITQTGDIVGTVRYMSPEQARGGAAALDHRADIYSLGATLYELAALAPAYEGESNAGILQSIINEEPRSLRRTARAAPRDLATIIGKCMQKDAALRYQDAAEVAEDLRRFLAEEPIKARPLPLHAKVKRWVNRHRGVTAAAAALIVLAVATAALADKLRHDEAERALENAYAAILFDQDFQSGAALLDRAERLGVDHARLHLYRGLIPLLSQEADEAIRIFEEQRRLEPNGLEAVYALARAYLDRGSFFDGQRLFETEGDRRPDTALGWFLRGYALSLHRPAEAIMCYDRAVGLQSNFVPAILERATYRGVRLMEEGRREELNPMLNDADAVVVFRPQSSLAYCRRAWIRLAAASYAETQPDLRGRAPEWLEGCRTDLDRAEKLNNPPDSKTYNVRGAYLRCIGDYEGSARAYEKSIALHQGLWNKPNAFLVHGRAIALHAAGDIAEALKAAETACRYTPDFYAVLLHYAVLLAEDGRMEEAREVCRRSLKAAETHATGLLLSIAVMEFLGGFEESEDYVRRIVDREMTGFTFEHLEQPTQRLDPDAPVTAYLDHRLSAADLLESVGDLPGRRCEYAFLIAMRELGAGRRSTGLAALRTCLDSGVFIYGEHRYSQAIMERAKADPGWPRWAGAAP